MVGSSILDPCDWHIILEKIDSKGRKTRFIRNWLEAAKHYDYLTITTWLAALSR